MRTRGLFMTGVDNLLAKSIDNTIRSNLSEKTLQKIETRLFEKYGISITQSLGEFQKLDGVLREFFGVGADGLERNILKNVCSMEKSKSAEAGWMVMEDQNLVKKILESFGDEDKKNIMSALTEEPRIISEVLEVCKIPQTSGYRKINALIDDGIIIPHGYITTKDGKKVNKYTSLFENVKIDIVKNKITVKVKIANEFLKTSSLVPIIQAL
jgi:hypothetical protein